MAYEFHSLKTPVLPFIYHEDTLEVSAKCWKNWHENVEFLFFLSGSALVVCDGVSYEMQPGQLLAVNHNCMHETHPHQTTTTACLIIGQGFFQQNGLDISHLAFSPRLTAAEVGKRFFKIMQAYRQSDACAVATVRSAVLDFLIWMIKEHSQTKIAPAYNTEKQDALLEAVRFIHARMPERVTMDEIASACGLSTSYFLHAFKQRFSCTVTRYVNRVRCEYAKSLLADGTYSVQECGYLSGFSDASYFTKVFSRMTGQTPSAFRRGQQHLLSGPR